MFKKLNLSEEILAQYGNRTRSFEKNEYLARMGAYPRSLFYILSGTVKVITINDDGTEYLHGFLTEGELMGVGTYLSDYKFYNDFIASEAVECVEISFDQFEAMIRDHHEISRTIMKNLADIIELKTLTLNAVMGKDPRDKILHALDRVKKYVLKNDNDPVPFTRQEMANYLGVRVETIIRAVKELEEEGILRIEKGKIYY